MNLGVQKTLLLDVSYTTIDWFLSNTNYSELYELSASQKLSTSGWKYMNRDLIALKTNGPQSRNFAQN